MSEVQLRRDESLGYLVNLMARQFAQALAERIRPLGVVPGQFPVLLSLWEADGLTQAELYRQVRIEQATMANTLKRMERDGLVERRPAPGDRRQWHIHLTERARALTAPLMAAGHGVNARATRGFTEIERDTLDALVRRVIANLDDADLDDESAI